jgi:hypothetical protein
VTQVSFKYHHQISSTFRESQLIYPIESCCSNSWSQPQRVSYLKAVDRTAVGEDISSKLLLEQLASISVKGKVTG